MAGDIFGNSVDSWTVEQAVTTTLRDWLSGHLRHQERLKGLPPNVLPMPRSWPMRSELDVLVHNKLPAVSIASPGTAGHALRDQTGAYRVTWRIEPAIAIAGKNEAEGRMLASTYLAAIRDALIQNPTLGGVVEECLYVGPDDHTPRATAAEDQRAIYSTVFEVTVRDVVNITLGPVDPPPDPTDPGDPPPTAVDIDIEVDLNP